MAAKKGKGWRSGRREGRSRMVQMTRHLVSEGNGRSESNTSL